MEASYEDIQQEIDDISALVADINDEEERSWLDQLELDNYNNQSLNVSASVLNELDEKRDHQFNNSVSLEASYEDIQQEIDDISALVADINDEEERSWLDQLDLNNSNNRSSINQSLDVSASVLNELDENTKDSWLFPVKGYEKRDYQFNISKSTLFHNTLVILPTGLGKTFIASVTIYNYMRWFPQSKVVFMAPTRPLVHQQMDACYDVVGIPKSQTAEMTGKASKKKRKKDWETKRVFFATPQVIQSDIKDELFPTNSIKLVVIDEAHKSKKNYAYCKVIEEIYRVNKNFRILALTATAGRTSDIIQIIKNLLISKIEYRCESSIDVQRYIHKKLFEIVPIKLTDDLREINDYFIKIIDPIITELRNDNAIQTNQISKGYLIMQRKKLLENLSIPNHRKAQALTNFSAAIGFYHSLEILQRHSVHLFLKSLRDETNKTSFKFFIARDIELTRYLKNLEEKYATVSPFRINTNPLPNGKIPNIPADIIIDFGHPKFEILKTKIINYFSNSEAKAIIFCEYRDTTQLIYTLLLQLRPKVVPAILVGQGGVMSQKAQLQIMQSFREGKTNTLICTSVAEEGLDIGEVDLVICFDISTKNTVRFVQRIGRTARKRTGQVIVLATEGHELRISKELLSSKDQMNNSVTKSKDIIKFLYKGAKLFPKDFSPRCIETKFVFAEDEESNVKNIKQNRTKKKKDLKSQASSKQHITNYLKPIEKKSETDMIELTNNFELSNESKSSSADQDMKVLCDNDLINDTKLQIDELDFRNMLKDYKERINNVLEKDSISKYEKAVIEYWTEKEIDFAKNLRHFLNMPPRKHFKIDNETYEIDFQCLEKDHKVLPSEIVMQDISQSPEKSFQNTSLKTPTVNFNSPLPLNFSHKNNSSTPISKVFSKTLQINTMKEKSPNASQSVVADKKFEFLGIMSIEDIFEGCDSRVDYTITKFSEHLQESSTENDIYESSIKDEPGASQMFKMLNIRSIFDIFDSPKHEVKGDETKYNDEMECLSDTTEIYDFREEMAKIEESKKCDTVNDKLETFNDKNHRNLNEDSQKEIFFESQTDLTIKKRDSKPNLSKLMSNMQEPSSIVKSNFMQENDRNQMDTGLNNSSEMKLHSLNFRCCTPKSQEKIIGSNESTPEFQNDKLTRFFTSPVSTKLSGRLSKKLRSRRILKSKKKMPHNSFLHTQAVDDETASSDEIEDQDDSVHEFVCNETFNDQSIMRHVYLKSLHSPSAPINNRLVLGQLRQPVNISNIYSQPNCSHEVETESDDMDSFIVEGDEEVESTASELDELEIAERKIIKYEQRRKRKLKGGDGAKTKIKRKIVVQHSTSSDEDDELSKLRKEVFEHHD